MFLGNANTLMCVLIASIALQGCGEAPAPEPVAPEPVAAEQEVSETVVPASVSTTSLDEPAISIDEAQVALSEAPVPAVVVPVSEVVVPEYEEFKEVDTVSHDQEHRYPVKRLVCLVLVVTIFILHAHLPKETAEGPFAPMKIKTRIMNLLGAAITSRQLQMSFLWFISCAIVMGFADVWCQHHFFQLLSDEHKENRKEAAKHMGHYDMSFNLVKKIFGKMSLDFQLMLGHMADYGTLCYLAVTVSMLLLFIDDSVLVLKRYFIIVGTLLLFRSVCIVVTVLPNPQHEVCVSNVEYHGWKDWFIAGMGNAFLLPSYKTCEDVLFSGHTVCAVSCVLLAYTYFDEMMHWAVKGLYCGFGIMCMVFIVSSRFHYSIDVVTSTLFTNLVWFLYHSYAKNAVETQCIDNEEEVRDDYVWAEQKFCNAVYWLENVEAN